MTIRAVYGALLLALLCVLPTLSWSAPLQNQLRDHPAPYLALHGRDPVAWQEWNAETVARARSENKLLFVSVGYFACHWCHVMQRESYADPAIAALLNRDFIPVKVDRELNGALDASLIEFSERLNGSAGWPLNVFVTPEGYPVHAVLYEPPEALKTVLEKVANAWRTRAHEMRRIAKDAAPIASQPGMGKNVTADVARRQAKLFQDAAWSLADPLQGGFGRTSKFPMAAQLNLLLDLQAESPKPVWHEFLVTTLDQMVSAGLSDQVNGGFFRYTVDPDWHTPHFEKMLYANAQLALLYHKAAKVLARPDYRVSAEAALDFILQSLAAPGGGYMTSTSALDAQGREGGAYLWEPAELKRRLSAPEYALVRRVWGLDQPSGFDLGYLPMLKVKLTPAEQKRYLVILAKLKAVGRMQTVPRDDKISAGLNGLALSALSVAGKDVPRFERAARKLAEFIPRKLMQGDQLIRARTKTRIFPEGEIDDYAYVSVGLLDYAQTNSDAGSRSLAQGLMQKAWRRYHAQTGWRREFQPLLATMRPETALADDAVPSPSHLLIDVALRLGDQTLKGQAEQALAMALPEMEKAPFDHPSGVRALRAWAALSRP